MECLLLSPIVSRIFNDVSPGHWRVQAVTIKFRHSTVLLINSYFPTDPSADETDLLETLSQIKSVILKNNFDSILWTGDINAYFLRNTSHTRTVVDIVDDLGLVR
jgi:hypothetical protein